MFGQKSTTLKDLKKDLKKETGSGLWLPLPCAGSYAKCRPRFFASLRFSLKLSARHPFDFRTLLCE